jgi:hypothetical protein
MVILDWLNRIRYFAKLNCIKMLNLNENVCHHSEKQIYLDVRLQVVLKLWKIMKWYSIVMSHDL